MDNQFRNFKDFLQLYNKLTEMCFSHCTDNFFTRQLTTEESNCLDKCVLKFSNVNQRVMTNYVHYQGIINERRVKEMEEQMKANEAAALAASNVPTTDASTLTPNDMDISSSISAVNSEETQSQSQNLAT
ncbi:mitochondrial import inner membrane translocase subunit Tim10B [Contarinia nasturtii]|uniref:mitochondrial import inner membrane translocase subunit Tim10B n=1 Tax=Contarinia nasturtii TaxID=265458 RepID=UPI0012D3CC3A|nr:mitochondrial import inner membrane translocase subunit Tim10B [Contarinia nasturtii]